MTESQKAARDLGFATQWVNGLPAGVKSADAKSSAAQLIPSYDVQFAKRASKVSSMREVLLGH